MKQKPKDALLKLVFRRDGSLEAVLTDELIADSRVTSKLALLVTEIGYLLVKLKHAKLSPTKPLKAGLPEATFSSSGKMGKKSPGST